MKFSKLIISMSAVLLLASCGQTSSSSLPSGGEQSSSSSSLDTSTSLPSSGEQSESSSEEPTEKPESSSTEPSSSSSSSSSSSESSSEEQEKYVIKIDNKHSEVTLTTDVSKACQGETVTVTVDVKNPNYKVTKVEADRKECVKVNDTTYTFVMPDHPVSVSCEVAVLTGDVYLQGDIAAVFEKVGDKYIAKNVKVAKDSVFQMVVKGEGGTNKYISITDFDRTKTFAAIGFGSKKNDLVIKGGSSYDFYYDVNNGQRPCYVKRVNVDKLPATAKDVQRLFDGSIRSASAVNPDNLVSTTYVNQAAQEKFEWKAFADNTSLGKAYNLLEMDKPLAYTYAKIDNSELTVVDTFAPGVNDAHKNNYVLVRDQDRFAGQYKISTTDKSGALTEDNEFEYKNNYINPNIADMVNSSNPFTMAAFECDIMYGYRVGYVIEDAITEADVKVTSTKNADGTFNTNIVSYRTYDSTKDRNSSGGLKQEHYEYRTDLLFSKEGALLKGKYKEKIYTSIDYDFTALKFVNGDQNYNWENTGKTANIITIENKYGERIAETETFNANEYLITSFANIKVENPEAGVNSLNIGNVAQEYLTGNYEPAGALNLRQYKIIASSNENVVGLDNDKYVAKNIGKSTLTLGIENGLGITANVEVNVVSNDKIRNVYLIDRRGQYPSVTSSDTGNIFLGGVTKYGIEFKESKHNKTCAMPLDASVTFVGESYGMKASLNREKEELIIDSKGSNAPVGATIKVALHTDSYDSGWVKEDKVFTFKTIPLATIDDFVGTWTSDASDLKGSSITFTKKLADPTSQFYKEERPYLGTVVCMADENNNDLKELQFMWGYNQNKNTFSAKLCDPFYELSDFTIEYNTTSKQLVVTLKLTYFSNGSYKNLEVFGFDIGEGFYEGDVFTKKVN